MPYFPATWEDLDFLNLHELSASVLRQHDVKLILKSRTFRNLFPFAIIFLVPIIVLKLTREVMSLFSWLWRETEPPVLTRNVKRNYEKRANGEADVDESELDEEKVVAKHMSGYYPGIVNLSGTYCFMNSVLQAMSSLQYLGPHLDGVRKRAEQLDVPSPLTDALQDFFNDLNTPSKLPRRPLHPHPIINALHQSPAMQKRSRAMLGSREHQDAQELFQLLGEGIRAESDAVRQEETQTVVGLGSLLEEPVMSSKRRGKQRDTGTPFDGLTANRRSCVVCGYTEAVMHFPFDNWTLPLPRMTASTSLETCLADSTRLEVLRDCICRKCSLLGTERKLRLKIKSLEGQLAAPSPSKEPQPNGHAIHEKENMSEKVAAPSDSKFSHLTIDASTSTAGTKPSSLTASKKKRLKHQAKNLEKDLVASRRGLEQVQLALEQNKLEDGLPGVEIEKVVSGFSTRQSVIGRPPPILTLHLNRSVFSPYSYGPSKNAVRVYFPEILDLTDYVSLSGGHDLEMRGEVGMCAGGEGLDFGHFSAPSKSQQRPGRSLDWRERTIYRLSSVICHYGTHSFGHYVCYRRKPDGRKEPPRIVGLGEGGTRVLWSDDGEGAGERRGGWLRSSDATVREVELDDVLVEGAGSCFLLFYEKALWDLPSDTDLPNQEKSIEKEEATSEDPAMKAEEVKVKVEEEHVKVETQTRLTSPSLTFPIRQARIVRSINAGLSRRASGPSSSSQSPEPSSSTVDSSSHPLALLSIVAEETDHTSDAARSALDPSESPSVDAVPEPSSPVSDSLSHLGSEEKGDEQARPKKAKKKKKKKPTGKTEASPDIPPTS